MINQKLKKYIEENIFPSYEKNDLGHNLDHIKYVIERSLKFAGTISEISHDMIYTIAAYHDIGHYIDTKNHEKISADMLLKDKKLKEFFTEHQIKIMAEAVYDHRASIVGDPRSVYGKIISSADRNTSVNDVLKRTYIYQVLHNPNDTLDQIIIKSRQHIIDKFGEEGYAFDKMYFKDLEYKKFLEDISTLSEDSEKFKKKFIEINNINN
ncbi:MAG: HD domain-containing protein [Bacilli bacterium]|nr:HD domain-containing protein [Bacilli bacterium]